MGEQYHKLVRDKITDKLDKLGVPYEKTIATEEEKKEWYIKKLEEEITEFVQKKNLEKLIDIDTIMDKLKTLPEFQDWEKAKAQKIYEKGGFEKGIILKGEK